MKAQIVETYLFTENEFENRLNIMVRYNKNSYAVTITTYHDFDESGNPVVKKINSFGYMQNVSRKSALRDKAIKAAITGMRYSY